MARSSKLFLFAVGGAFLIYLILIVTGINFYADLVSSIFGLLAAGVVFFSVISSKNKTFRPNFWLVGTAIYCWAMGDILWFVFENILGIDATGNGTILTFYFAATLLLAAATLFFAFGRLRKWDTVQLFLDGIIFSIAILWFFWVVLYGKTTAQLQALLGYSVIHTLIVTLDVFMIIIISIWYLSIRRGKVPGFLWFLVGAVFLYSVTDLVYYHLYIRGLYLPDSFVDVCYLVALLGMAIGIRLFYDRYPAVYTDPNPNTNIGHGHKGILLALFPLGILLLHPIDATDLALYAVLIIAHEASSRYIQKAIRDKTLLREELNMNQKLEELVSEQTKSLQAANEQLQKRNVELHFINQHDPLTELYNRTYFLDRLSEAVHDAKSTDMVALLLWNVDNLTNINDTYGHLIGDELLIEHAKRIQALLDGKGTLARFGGDEFGFFLEGAFDPDAVMRIARQVVADCETPIQIDEYTFRITISVGLSMTPVCASDQITLLKNADIAMQHAKKTNIDGHIAKFIDINTAIERMTLIGSRLKTIDFSSELTLHYQPQFRMKDRKLIGMEALLRWNCPKLGFVSPAEFIPIAEAENQIIPIGNWVMETTVRQIALWNRAFRLQLRMGINFSPKQFDQASTFDTLAAAMKRNGTAGEWIDIEITEGVALDRENGADIIKKRFRSKGISVSIDDFGTGYSSLGYLSILSFDRLKIAKPLIDKITFDDSCRKIVTSIILLSQSLDLATLSEGVETQEQFDLLVQLGCDQMQGYLLGKPVPAEEFEALFLKSLQGGDAQ